MKTEIAPSHEDVAKRALCLVALVNRSDVEYFYQQMAANARLGDEPEDDAARKNFEETYRKVIADLTRWTKQEKLKSYLSPKEKKLFAKQLGAWEEQEMVDASWRRESLGVLLWSLSMVNEIPPYDRQFDKLELEHLELKNSTARFYSSTRLRSSEEISNARDVAELWHWRSRTTQLIEQGGITPPQGLTFEQIIKQSAEFAFRDGMNPKPISNDFPVLNKAYRDLSDEEYGMITSIAIERHFALNWLNGYSKDWDNTPTDT